MNQIVLLVSLIRNHFLHELHKFYKTEAFFFTLADMLLELPLQENEFLESEFAHYEVDGELVLDHFERLAFTEGFAELQDVVVLVSVLV